MDQGRDINVPSSNSWVSSGRQSSGAYIDFFGRLREERARLGLTQQEVADAAQVHVKTVRRWESLVAVPLDAMVPLVGIGYDVQYIASGVRSKNIHEVREKGIDYEVSPGATRGEVELLRSYRALTPPQREQARRAARSGKAETTKADTARTPPRRTRSKPA